MSELTLFQYARRRFRYRLQLLRMKYGYGRMWDFARGLHPTRLRFRLRRLFGARQRVNASSADAHYLRQPWTVFLDGAECKHGEWLGAVVEADEQAGTVTYVPRDEGGSYRMNEARDHWLFEVATGEVRIELL